MLWASWFQAVRYLNSMKMCGSTPCFNQNHCFFDSATAHSGPDPPHSRGFSITLRHTTIMRTPVDEWSIRRRYLYLTIHNTHKKQTSIHTAGLEHTIPSSKRLRTHVLGRATTGIGAKRLHWLNSSWNFNVPACKWSKSNWNIEREQYLPPLV
jgi:hypothetical protein